MAREEGSVLDCLSLNLGGGVRIPTQGILLDDYNERAKLWQQPQTTVLTEFLSFTGHEPA
jgi:hypothetical protein